MLNKGHFPGIVPPVLDKLNSFMRTPGYIALVAILAGLSSALGLEVPVFTCFALFALLACFWGEDLLPVMPLLIFMSRRR